MGVGPGLGFRLDVLGDVSSPSSILLGFGVGGTENQRQVTVDSNLTHVHTAFLGLSWVIAKLAEGALVRKELGGEGVLTTLVGRHSPAQSIDHLFSEPAQWLVDLLGRVALDDCLIVSGQRGKPWLPIRLGMMPSLSSSASPVVVRLNGADVDRAMIRRLIASMEGLWSRTRPDRSGGLRIQRAGKADIEWLNAVGTDASESDDPAIESINHYRVEPKLREGWFAKNPDGFSILKRNGRPIGIVELLPLRPEAVKELFDQDGRFDEMVLSSRHIFSPNEVQSPTGFQDIYLESIFIDPSERAQRLALEFVVEYGTDLLLQVGGDIEGGRIYAYPVAPPGKRPGPASGSFGHRRYARTVSGVQRFLGRPPFFRKCRTRVANPVVEGSFHDLMCAPIREFLKHCDSITWEGRTNRARTYDARKGQAHADDE